MKKLTKNNIKMIIKEEYESIQNEIANDPPSFVSSILEGKGGVDRELGNKFKEAVYSVIKDLQNPNVFENKKMIRESGTSNKTFNLLTKSDWDGKDLREVLQGCNVEYLDVGKGRHTLFLERRTKRAQLILEYLKDEGVKFKEVNRDWK